MVEAGPARGGVSLDRVRTMARGPAPTIPGATGTLQRGQAKKGAGGVAAHSLGLLVGYASPYPRPPVPVAAAPGARQLRVL